MLVAPIGFVSDHLEVLYDLDIEAKTVAKELDIRLERIDSLNTDPLYMETLSDVILNSMAKE
ncbi:Ferrochelatase 1 [compost metagenome]